VRAGEPEREPTGLSARRGPARRLAGEPEREPTGLEGEPARLPTGLEAREVQGDAGEVLGD
jgi:hypothetical protein